METDVGRRFFQDDFRGMRVDDPRHDVDEQHAAAGLGKGCREGQADVAGPDDCDVIRHGLFRSKS